MGFWWAKLETLAALSYNYYRPSIGSNHSHCKPASERFIAAVECVLISILTSNDLRNVIFAISIKERYHWHAVMLSDMSLCEENEVRTQAEDWMWCACFYQIKMNMKQPMMVYCFSNIAGA